MRNIKKGFILIIILSGVLTGSLSAQVAIKERVEIESQVVSGSPFSQINSEGVSEPGTIYYPELRPIGPGKYLVLKSGTLNMYFSEAATYDIPTEQRAINYTVTGPGTNLGGSVNLGEFMSGPVTIEDKASVCREEKAYYQSSLTYDIGSIQDSFVSQSAPTANFAHNESLVAFYLENPQYPDSAHTLAFIDFGVDSLYTNALLSGADLILQHPDNFIPSDLPFYVYHAEGSWSESSLNYNNRPPVDRAQIIPITPDNIVENTTYIYQKVITPIVDNWLQGLKPDYGIAIASTGEHHFSSREAFGALPPQIELDLFLPNDEADNILRIGEVQAGDMLTIEFPGLSTEVSGNYSSIPNGEDAEDRFVFYRHNPCLTNRVVALPYISGADEDRYLEFVSNLDTTIPVDQTGGDSMYVRFLEPALLYDNEEIRSPEEIFTNNVMELYEVPVVNDTEGNPSLLASFSFRNRLETIVFPNDEYPGADLLVLNLPEFSGMSFKVRMAGWMIKDLTPSKVAGQAVDKQIIEALLSTNDDITMANVDDPTCGFPGDPVADNVFVSCFEFTIGEKDELIVEAEPDSVYPGGSSVLTAKLVTAEGDTSAFEPGNTFEVSINEVHREWGSLLSSTGDTADVITNPGPDFAFLSNTSVEEEKEIEITIITAYEDKVLRTTKRITVLTPYDLAFEFEGDDEVWPTLRGGNSEANNVKQVTVTVSENDIPVPNHEIELSVQFILGTGGHDHTTAPDTDLLGTLRNSATNATAHGTIIGTTNGEGEIAFSYIASEIGGRMQFVAQSVSQIGPPVRDTLNILVPDLEYLGTSPYYELVGAPQFNNTTNDPCRTEASLRSQHAFGHYGTQDLNQQLQLMARLFYHSTDSTKLRYNDVSLTNGGVFDINNDWVPDHNSHRKGIQADIGIDTINKLGECVEGGDSDLVNQAIIGRTFNQIIAYSTHYHVKL
jgi:hypothetical protein